ncbi:DUF4255 domain-containing protein [Chryseobacterium sp. YIM B08800]|uniref:DUF4255 domain-containing protein n=1 Tax=Chryseobacterium sp. YIM B08800 TaxID=2984136 RepID=UPI00223EB583|nr:DUF4255 domain-containing protein [Chryseobacterium sp. YIM B08800]
MINEVLTILKNQLNGSEGLQDVLGDIAVVDDIAKHDDDTSGLENKVVITLLNVEEESTLKNRSRYNKVQISENPTQFDMKMESPPAYLNLYVMIAAHRATYVNALANISKVIEVFQTNNVLEYLDPDDERENDFKFRIELHTVPFEQLSYIWGLLGGKVMPSVLYKISVIKIVAKDVTSIELINDINIESIKVN